MVRILVQTVFLLYLGLLIGEVPTGRTTVGRTAWKETVNLFTWSSGQLQSMVSYAGLGDSSITKWIGKTMASLKPAPRQTDDKPESEAQPKHDEDSEGLTATDKEALRRILE